MTKYSCPRYPDLFLDILLVLEKHGGTASNAEIFAWLVERRKFSDEILSEKHSGSTKKSEVEYQTEWARTYLGHAGFIQRIRHCMWGLTEKGREVCRTKQIDPKAICKSVREMQEQKKRNSKAAEARQLCLFDGIEDTETNKKGNNMEEPTNTPKNAQETLKRAMRRFWKDHESDMKGWKDERVFVPFCADCLYFGEARMPIDRKFLEAIPDGAKDGGIDAIFINPNNSNELVVLQCKHYVGSKLQERTFEQDLNTIIDTLRDLREWKDGKYNNKLRHAYAAASSELDDDFSVTIDFCVAHDLSEARLAKMRVFARQKEQDTGFDIRVHSCKDINDTLTVNASGKDYVKAGNLRINPSCGRLDYGESIVVNIFAQSLKSLYAKYGKVLLGKNLRYHINGKSKQNKEVDDGIKNTIKKSPDDFWYLNNGILIVCEDFKTNGDTLELMNFSVVNGGQTTYQIYMADLPSDFCLLCKVVKVPQDKRNERDEFCKMIATATNSQKPMKWTDLISNEREQNDLRNALAEYGYFYIVKAGDQPEKPQKKWPKVGVEAVGRSCLAGVLLQPGSARSKSQSMQKSEYYDVIFKKTPPRVIADVLTLTELVKQYQEKKIKMEGLTKDERDVLKNGERFYVAGLGSLLRISKKVFDKATTNSLATLGDDDMRDVFLNKKECSCLIGYNGDDLNGCVSKVCDILTKVFADCCEIERKVAERSQTSYDCTNLVKKDSFFFRVLKEKLLPAYSKNDSMLKTHIKTLAGVC